MPGPAYADAEIVIIDDEPAVVRFLSRALQMAGYREPRTFSDSLAAVSYLETADPDLITLDICMPGLDGYGVLESLRNRQAFDSFLPVLAISALDDFESHERAIKAGAKDFLVKPVNVNDFLLHVHSLLDTRFLERRLREHAQVTEDMTREHASELALAHLETLERLVRIAELRGDETGQHATRVARLSALIARELNLSPRQLALILRAAPLHDVGKIMIEDQLLLKKGRLTEEERDIVRSHTEHGGRLLGGGRSDIMKMAEAIARFHHERWDGHGYPDGLAGEAIPLAARIVAVADTFDALTHARFRRDASTISEATSEIELERGLQFDPQVVDALLRVLRHEETLLLVLDMPRPDPDIPRRPRRRSGS
ncbi:MAG: response regulator [Actinobacteria bacterium]|jgi:putative two-component system response regulator|nr:response regulator [Actinomycetota bacterium]